VNRVASFTNPLLPKRILTVVSLATFGPLATHYGFNLIVKFIKVLLLGFYFDTVFFMSRTLPTSTAVVKKILLLDPS
jgi:hypothetical protein